MSVHPWFHSSLLKPHHGPIPEPVELAVEGEPGQEEYEVQSILDRRVARNRIEYLVQWKGYGAEDNTWEPLSNLKNAQVAVAEFEKLRAAPREGKRVVRMTTKMKRMKEDLEDFT